MLGKRGKFRFVVKAIRLVLVCMILVMFWAAFHSGVTLASDKGGAPAPNFSSDVAPILQKNCLACHTSSTKMGDLVMESYNSLIKGGIHGPVIVPHNARESRLS